MYNIKQHTQYYIRLVFSKEENNTIIINQWNKCINCDS